jgi:adenylate kinase
MRLVLVGPPGSGKGTQAALLHQRLGAAHIGTGDILREAVHADGPIGRLVEPYVRTGKLVPDDVVNELVTDLFRRENRPRSFVMDGYPRTLAQALAFDATLKPVSLELQRVFLFTVDDELVVKRLSGRRRCSDPTCEGVFHAYFRPPKAPWSCDICGKPLVQRPDDKEEVIRARLKLYHASTADLINYYRGRGLLHEVKADAGVESIYQTIVGLIPPSG